jgi:golgin subfamily A protein 1
MWFSNICAVKARYLVKAIATFLKFTPQEEKFVKEFMDYKVSWFGSKPYIHNSK